MSLPPEGIFHIQKGMMRVCYALLPCFFVSVYVFGWRSLAVMAVTLAFGTATEALFTLRRDRPVTSAVFVSCMILALSLPPTLPLWMCAVGAVVGVGLGKMAFGGFGRNVFNPAMVGRCFIYVAFPVHMTNSWIEPVRGGAAGLAAWSGGVDALTRATPLEVFRGGGTVSLRELFLGTTSGSLGETSAAVILLGGIYLVASRVAPWRIALSCLAGGVAASVLLGAVGPTGMPDPLETVLCGSFLFGTAFVATEPISGAKTREGQLIYGFTIGAVTVLIRAFSNFSEGIMFSVLLMNAFVPLLDRSVEVLRRSPVPARSAA